MMPFAHRLPVFLTMAPRRRRAGGDESRGDGSGGDASTRPPFERRQHGRRADDLDPEQLRGWAFWAQLVFVHRAKLIIVLSGVSGFGGYLIATTGLIRRVTVLESLAHTNTDRIGRLEENDKIKTYMLCVLVRKADPLAAPPECGPVSQLPAAPPRNFTR